MCSLISAACGPDWASNEKESPSPLISLEAPPGFEPGIRVLQTHALPLGYGAVPCAALAQPSSGPRKMAEARWRVDEKNAAP